MKKHFKYTSIEQFRNTVSSIRSCAKHYNVNTDDVVMTFEGSVKLHGTNAAVILDVDGNYYGQSRERVLSAEEDNMGFAKMIQSNEYKSFLKLLLQKIMDEAPNRKNLLSVGVFGEFAGQGIMKQVGISNMPKFFAPFDVCLFYPYEGNDKTKQFDVIYLDSNFLKEFENESLRIFPSYPTYTMDINFNDIALAEKSNEISNLTINVENECPFAKKHGFTGIGEGVVWKFVKLKDNPNFPEGFDNFKYHDLMFKVKGEKHSVSKVKTLAPVDVEKLKKIADFVEYACTENRLNQGIEYLKEQNIELSTKSTSDYIRWVMNDILKEESDVIKENNIDWKSASKLIGKKTANFWSEKLDNISFN